MPGLEKNVSKSRKDINTSADPLLGTKVRSALQPAPLERQKFGKPWPHCETKNFCIVPEQPVCCDSEADVFCVPGLWALVFAHCFCH